MSTLGGIPILSLEAHIPPAGAWWARCQLDSSQLPELGPTVLVIGDLVLTGSITRREFSDHPGGGLVTALCRGGAGWLRPVPRAGRYEGGGVRMSTVLADVAGMAGEVIEQPADVEVGDALSWEAHQPAAPVHLEDVLADLVARGYLATWRVEPATGRTVFSPWPTLGAADGWGRVTNRASTRGRRSVGLDVAVAAFLPGAVLEGVTIARTRIAETAGELRAEVYDR